MDQREVLKATNSRTMAAQIIAHAQQITHGRLKII